MLDLMYPTATLCSLWTVFDSISPFAHSDSSHIDDNKPESWGCSFLLLLPQCFSPVPLWYLATAFDHGTSL